MCQEPLDGLEPGLQSHPYAEVSYLVPVARQYGMHIPLMHKTRQHPLPDERDLIEGQHGQQQHGVGHHHLAGWPMFAIPQQRENRERYRDGQPGLAGLQNNGENAEQHYAEQDPGIGQ
ncbi:hypothetical protein D3C77_620400 [compost metagenome]